MFSIGKAMVVQRAQPSRCLGRAGSVGVIHARERDERLGARGNRIAEYPRKLHVPFVIKLGDRRRVCAVVGGLREERVHVRLGDGARGVRLRAFEYLRDCEMALDARALLGLFTGAGGREQKWKQQQRDADASRATCSAVPDPRRRRAGRRRRAAR